MRVKTTPPGNRPFFTCVMPLYNKRDYVLRSIGSVLGQGFKDLELIVVDDGSTDGGPAVVKGIGDKRVRLIRRKNAGVSAARNLGVSKARGRFVAFLDADDEWAPGFLEAMKGLTLEFPDAGLYGSNYWLDDGRSRWVNPVRLPAGWRGQRKDYYDLMYYARPPFCTNTVTIPARVAKAEPFPVGIKAGEDLYVWFKISQTHPTAYLNEPLSVYYIAAQNNTHADYYGDRYHLDWIEVADGFEKEGTLTKEGRKYASWIALFQSRKMVLSGRKEEGLRMLDRCPKGLFVPYRVYVRALSLAPLGSLRALKRGLSRLAGRLRPGSGPGAETTSGGR